MIKYKLNITDCYPQVICLDNNIGLKSYFSIFDIINKKRKLIYFVEQYGYKY